MRETLRKVFLGSAASYRNGHRDWLYLGFVLVILAAIAWKKLVP